jgi:hypothetical protein
MIVVLVLAGVAIGVPLGIYGHWSGWGFGLGWWGKPTPARVLEVTPLTGAVMKGHADYAMVEQSHRVHLLLELQPDGGEPYRASAVSWSQAGGSWAGRTVVTRVSRTRPSRVHVPRNASDAAQADETY